MAKIKRKDAMNMVAIMCAGAFANPASGNIMTDQYARQQIIQQILQDTQNALMFAGIDIIDEDEKESKCR